MKYLSFSFLLFSLSISAAFDDYLNLNSFLKQSDVNNDKVFVLLNNKRLFSTDYHPSSYIRARDEYPRYPSTMIKRGIEGYAEIEFTINPDGSTSNHKVIESMPGSYFDKNSLTAKVLGIIDREWIALKLNELFVIEYYSRKI